MTDAAGDQVSNPDTDIVSENISESMSTGQRNLVFTMKVTSAASLTQNARRIFTFKAKTKDFYVAMINNPSAAAPAFVYGTGVNGFGTSTDKLGDGLAGSGYKTDGTITVIAPAAAFSVGPGDTLGTFAGVVRLSGGDCSQACVNGAASDTATAPATNTYTLTAVEESCPGPADSDGDGVFDSADNCQGTPPGTPVNANGCPLVTGGADTCAVPGKTMLTDVAGDTASGTAGTDLLKFQLTQPPPNPTSTSIDDQYLVFTITTDPGATLSPLYFWFVSFNSPAGVQGVRMIGDANGNPVFQSYFVQADTNGNSYGTFASSTKPADARSSFDATKGLIKIWVKATDLGLTAAGDQLKGFNSGAIQIIDTPVASGSNTEDGMPNNDLTRSNVDYTLHDNTVCGAPALQPPGPPGLATGQPPRFYDFQSPAGLADHAGEPTVGYNPSSFAAMIIAGTEVDRILFAEHSPARDAANLPLPESCPATWQDASYAGAVNTLDPILETYQPAGRTFQSSLSGANSIFAYSDDDGATWTPGQAGPPNGGADHQTVGAGPFAPGAKPVGAITDYATFYCSQSVAAAFCARSDDGGISFGPGIPFRNSATDCQNSIGGLHGHVQVAPNDGTVYVPFGNCNGKVAVSVSNDSGTTWTLKSLPVNGGQDPGLGVGADGTAYLCYQNGNKGKAYATVSSNKGDTWSEPYDLGASLGIKHTVFTTMAAGDGDRAACAFLGTTTDGSPGAADFPGVWYPYVAMTYDRGKTWHTVNVSNGDPAQGAGGICTDGTTCGSNRNLLDFNDIIKSEQGRVLFGYADGCRGACVSDPTNIGKNGLADNGVIARQSGGRTLFAAMDDKPGTQFNSTNPIAPAAACMRADQSVRSATQADVWWNAGDTGGAPISNYKLYRSESVNGTYTLLAETGTASHYLDTSVLDTVPHYYYKVVAENAQGAALYSNIIDLPISLTPLETSCQLPGITVGVESTPGDCTGTGGGCIAQTNLERIYVAELPDHPDEVTFTIKVQDLNPAPAPGNYWFLLTKKVSGENLYFSMDTSQGSPRYAYGTYEVGTLTSFTEQGTITGSNEVDGQIHLHAPKALFGTPALKVGDAIVGLEARTRVGSSSGTSRDGIVGDDYVLRGTEICAIPPVVKALLDATPLAGKAPLDVTFTIGGVPSTGKALESYSLTFGDEQGPNPAPFVGTFGGQGSVQVKHRYQHDGVFRALLSVKDSGGNASTNVATKTIEVGVAPALVPETAGNNRLGGAFPPLSLVTLGILLLARRRR